jgi:hypothetical protein
MLPAAITTTRLARQDGARKLGVDYKVFQIKELVRAHSIVGLAVTLSTASLWQWAELWDELLKVAISAFAIYMSKNLLTSEDGKFAGVIYFTIRTRELEKVGALELLRQFGCYVGKFAKKETFHG